MPFSHLSLAVLVMAVWGLNFIAVRWALDEVPPLTFAALRFSAVVLPLIFFIPRPRTPISLLIGFATTAYTIQFCLLVLAMWLKMPTGLASLVTQSQVFFTMALALARHDERPARWQIIGVLIGSLGIVAVGFDLGQTMPLLAFMVTLGAALAWSVGNSYVKSIGAVDTISLVVWSSLIAALSLIPLSILIEGTEGWTTALLLLGYGDTRFWGSLLFNAFGASLIGYSGWSWLLHQHPAPLVAPVTLLVPVFGLAAAALILDETIAASTWPGIILVFIGLALTQFRGFQSWLIWRRRL